jgi:penicillin-binding protein 2
MEQAVLRSPYAPAVVIPQPSRALADYIEERAERFPGIHIEAVPSRSYPQGGAGAEFLGLLGEVSARQLTKDVYPGAKPGQLVGQSGVEARYDRWLDGGFRRARLPVDSQGRILGPLRPSPKEKPLPTLRLTIDMRIQRAAEHAVEDGIALAHKNGHGDSAAGAAVVMDARNGALLALASVPTYNQLLAAHDPSYLEQLLHADTQATPLLNRAIQGLYPTGSTFKPIVAEAALRAGLITPASSLLCSGSFTIGGFTFHNVEPGIYSYMSLPTALAQSCDTWFYRLGDLLYTTGHGLAIQQQAHLFGLGHTTGLDLPGEYGGVVPTPSWLERTYKEQWYEGQTINLSIGQGYLAVTPLQLAVAYAALANGGTVVRPHVAEAIGHHILRFKPVRHLKLPDLWAIHDGLFSAAHSAIGTSSAIFGSYEPAVAGKTGTAETGHGSDHSWYASWAPAGNPRYVVVVLIEHGGFGAEAAAPAAKEIYDALFHPHG